jgi:hypothetical protein
MKSLNGLVFIILGALAIWIGATGRLPALASALGMVRAAPGTGNKPSTSSAPKAAAQNPPFVNPKVSSYFSDVGKAMDQPFSATWQGAMKDLGWFQ